jgi:hypothetical protein
MYHLGPSGSRETVALAEMKEQMVTILREAEERLGRRWRRSTA